MASTELGTSSLRAEFKTTYGEQTFGSMTQSHPNDATSCLPIAHDLCFAIPGSKFGGIMIPAD